MDFLGRVVQVIGETNGISKAGNPWKKKEWVVETFGQYPRKVKLQCFGDRADLINLEMGKDYTLYVDLDSREFNGRWYTDVSVYRVEEYNVQVNQPVGQPGGFQPAPQQPGPAAPYVNNPGFGGGAPDFSSPAAGESDEDLPF